MKPSELLANPAAWTQGTSARDENGTPVDGRSPKAVCWCILGALHKCMPTDDKNQALNKYRGAVLDMIPSDVAVWNDYPARKHEEVLALLAKVEEKLCL